MISIAKQAKKVAASIPTIRRLPSYLAVVKRHRADGNDVISGTVIAQELRLEAIQVRKDLGVTGMVGKPRVGYPVDELEAAIERFLGWDQHCKAIIVGAGNLGSALMGYKELKDHGLSLVAAFDKSPTQIGPRDSGITVYHINDLKPVVTKEGAKLAILTVPLSEAQGVCDALVDVGIYRIWNFTNAHVHVPNNVMVLREDISSGFAVLTTLGGITN